MLTHMQMETDRTHSGGVTESGTFDIPPAVYTDTSHEYSIDGHLGLSLFDPGIGVLHGGFIGSAGSSSDDGQGYWLSQDDKSTGLEYHFSDRTPPWLDASTVTSETSTQSSPSTCAGSAENCDHAGHALHKTASHRDTVIRARSRYTSPVTQYQCPECGLSLGASRTLSRHRKEVHVHGRRYICPHLECKYHRLGFPRRESLKRHLERMRKTGSAHERA